jgi:tripartite-type tricarboxylate transporter receptor subunit TctC
MKNILLDGMIKSWSKFNSAKNKVLKQFVLMACCTLFASLTHAQSSPKEEFPDRPIKFVVPFAPGGPTDIIARILSQKLTTLWGQAVVVDNRPGANGNTGTTQVAKSKPDGYTILLNTSSVAVNTSLFINPGYNLEKDFVGVANVASTPNIFVAGASLQEKTLKEAMEGAKSGKYNYASPGEGTTPHLSAEYLFRVLAKVPVMHIPYKGAGPAVNAALTGEVQFASVAVPAASQLILGGQLRGLAVTSSKRLNSLPNVPTVAESGFSGFEDYTWVGVFVPKDTPQAIINKLNTDIATVSKQEDFKERLAALGFEGVGGSVETFNRYLRAESLKWSRVVKDIGITPQ